MRIFLVILTLLNLGLLAHNERTQSRTSNLLGKLGMVIDCCEKCLEADQGIIEAVHLNQRTLELILPAWLNSNHTVKSP